MLITKEINRTHSFPVNLPIFQGETFLKHYPSILQVSEHFDSLSDSTMQKAALNTICHSTASLLLGSVLVPYTGKKGVPGSLGNPKSYRTTRKPFNKTPKRYGGANLLLGSDLEIGGDGMECPGKLCTICTTTFCSRSSCYCFSFHLFVFDKGSKPMNRRVTNLPHFLFFQAH